MPISRLLWLLLAALGFAASPARAQIILIANSSLNADTISRDDLRDIFTGASTGLRSGQRAKPVLLNKGPAHDLFMSTYIGLNDRQFRSDWLSLVFAGKTAMPVSFDTESEVVDYVAQHPSAIGYIHKITPHAAVKTLTMK
jgi:hypothetical protein